MSSAAAWVAPLVVIAGLRWPGSAEMATTSVPPRGGASCALARPGTIHETTTATTVSQLRLRRIGVLPDMVRSSAPASRNRSIADALQPRNDGRGCSGLPGLPGRGGKSGTLVRPPAEKVGQDAAELAAARRERVLHSRRRLRIYRPGYQP